MNKISSITIARNEAANIRRCINSLLPVVDEIVILVDDSSTDETLDIVKEFPQVKFEISTWQGYSKTKTKAINLCSHRWILWIDADEELSPALQNELAELKPKLDETIVAYSLPRLAWFLGRWIRHSGWYPGRIDRLFDKTKVYFSDTHVHESLVIPGPTGKLNSDLYHYTDTNIHHYYHKFNNYTSLAARDLNTKNRTFKITDLLIRPAFLFFKMYILKAGFLDGLQGFILAVFSAHYVFTKYAKLWELKSQSQLTDK